MVIPPPPRVIPWFRKNVTLDVDAVVLHVMPHLIAERRRYAAIVLFSEKKKHAA